MKRTAIGLLATFIALAIACSGSSSAPVEAPAGFSLDMRVTPSTLALRIGQSGSLLATLPDTPNASPIVWTSSDTSVATVQPGGVVVGRAAGSANIIASYGAAAGIAQITVSP
jgi:hypothetical protein